MPIKQSNKQSKMPNKQRVTQLPKLNQNFIYLKYNQGIKWSEKNKDKPKGKKMKQPHNIQIKQEILNFQGVPIDPIKIFKWNNTQDMLIKIKRTSWKNITFNLVSRNKQISDQKKVQFTPQLISSNQLIQSYNLKLRNWRKEKSKNNLEKLEKSKFYKEKKKFSNKKYKNNFSKETLNKVLKAIKKMFKLKLFFKKISLMKNSFKILNKNKKRICTKISP